MSNHLNTAMAVLLMNCYLVVFIFYSLLVYLLKAGRKLLKNIPVFLFAEDQAALKNMPIATENSV